VQTIPLISAGPSIADAGQTKKRKRPVPAGSGISRAQRAERRESGYRKSARVASSSRNTQPSVGEDEHEEDTDLSEDESHQDTASALQENTAPGKQVGRHDALGVKVLHHARLLAENFSMQAFPQAHEHLARVAVDTALALPSGSTEADLAWGCARALARSLHGPGCDKAVLKQLLPGVLRPSSTAATVKDLVAFVDSCLAERVCSASPVAVPAATCAQDQACQAAESSAPAAPAMEHEGDRAKEPKQREETFEDALLVLCHHLCVRVGDRAHTRVQVSLAVCGVLDVLRARRGAEAERMHLVSMGRFLGRLSRHAKPSLRLVACELAGVLLYRQRDESLKEPCASAEDAVAPADGEGASKQHGEGDKLANADGRHDETRVLLLRTLFKRSSDKLPSVRAKALAGIATALQHGDTARQLLLGLDAASWAAAANATANLSLTMNQSALNVTGPNQSARLSMDSRGRGNLVQLNMSSDTAGADVTNTSIDGMLPGVTMLGDDFEGGIHGVWEMVRRRCEDPKSFVRKSAVQVLEARLHLMLHAVLDDMPQPDATEVAALVKACQDASVLVRKQALDALTALVSHDLDADVFAPRATATSGRSAVLAAWVTNVLRMVRDREPTVADHAVDSVARVLLEPMADSKLTGKPLPAVTLAVLALLTDESRLLLQCACRALGRRKPSGLPQGLARRLLTRLAAMHAASAEGVTQERADVLWWVLEEVAPLQTSSSGSSTLDHSVLLNTYRHGSETHAAAALRTATRMSSVGALPAALASELFAELVSGMCGTQTAPPRDAPALLHDMVKAAAQLARSLPAVVAALEAGKEWASALLQAADKRMAPKIEARLRAQVRDAEVPVSSYAECMLAGLHAGTEHGSVWWCPVHMPDDVVGGVEWLVPVCCAHDARACVPCVCMCVCPGQIRVAQCVAQRHIRDHGLDKLGARQGQHKSADPGRLPRRSPRSRGLQGADTHVQRSASPACALRPPRGAAAAASSCQRAARRRRRGCGEEARRGAACAECGRGDGGAGAAGARAGGAGQAGGT
jgi:hypothetical protein